MIRLGTRGSALALTQAKAVGERLGEYEIVVITTPGDRGESVGDKARWTSALEAALLSGEIDAAVHSAKDVPGELAEGTVIAAVPERADPRDAIVGCAEIASLRSDARIGTSSIRRAAQLRALRDDIQVVELRGNVDTRLRKLEAGEVDAVVLAAAGLKRLGREDVIGGYLDDVLPAPGQGALLVQARAEDVNTGEFRALSSLPAEMQVRAERAFAHALGASCNTPIGALADDGRGPQPMRLAHVRLRGWVGLPDGSHWIADEYVGLPEEAGHALAQRMIAVGARELLEQAEGMARA